MSVFACPPRVPTVASTVSIPNDFDRAPTPCNQAQSHPERSILRRNDPSAYLASRVPPGTQIDKQLLKSFVAYEAFRSAHRTARERDDSDGPDKMGRGPHQYVIGAPIKRIRVTTPSIFPVKVRPPSFGVKDPTSHLGQFHEPHLASCVLVERTMDLPREGMRMGVQRVHPSWSSARRKQSSRNMPYA